MTAPTDSRAEARALMRRVEKDKGKWAYVNHVRPLLAALEAALEREERQDRIEVTARDYMCSCDENLAAFQKRRMPDIPGEQRALAALRKALDS